MKNYLVKLVYQIICGDGRHTAQFDEQLRFVTAFSREEALQKSTRIGRQEEEIFSNDKRQLVRWTFINASEIYCLDKLSDGAEVFSQIRETDDALSYCRFVHHKADLLQTPQKLFRHQTT